MRRIATPSPVAPSRHVLHAALVALALLACDAAPAGTITPGTYMTSPPPTQDINTFVVSGATNTSAGLGQLATLGPVTVTFPVTAQPTGNTTTYSFSDQIQNLDNDRRTWVDFEFQLGGNVMGTFGPNPFSNVFTTSSRNATSTTLDFAGGSVPFGGTVVFSFTVVVPNPPQDTAGVLILMKSPSVPEPSSLVMASVAALAGLGAWGLRRAG